MTKDLQELFEAVKDFVLTPEEKEQQRRRFAYGNVVIKNSRITRETPPQHAKPARWGPRIDRAADELNGLSLG